MADSLKKRYFGLWRVVPVALVLALSFALLPMKATPVLAASRTFTGPGNFSDAAKWSAVPAAGDTLLIKGQCTFDNAASNLAYGALTLGVNPTAGSVVWPEGGTNTLNVTGITSAVAGGSIDMTYGGTLQIGVNNWTTTNMTFTPGAGTIIWVDTAGASTLPAAITTYNNLTITATGRVASLGVATTVNGNLYITGGTLSASASNFALDVKGNFTNDGTFTPTSGTVTLSGTGDQTLNGSTTTTFNNLTINKSSGTAYITTTPTVSSTFTMTAGNVSYNGTDQNVLGATYPSNLTMSGSGTKTLTGNTVVTGTLTIDSGVTLFTNSYTLSYGSLVNNGSIANARTASVDGNWSNTATWGGASVPTSSDFVTINSGINVTVDGNYSCGKITFNAPAASGDVTISGSNTLTVSGAITMNAATAAFTTSLAVGAGTLNASSITINGAATATWVNQVTVSTGTINCTGDIILQGGSKPLSNVLNVTGNGTINLGGNLTKTTGTVTLSSTSTVNCNGTSAQTVAGVTYNELRSNNTAGVTLAAAATITTLTIGNITSNSVFNDGGFVITPGASSVLNISNSGTYNLGSTGTGTAWPAWGTRNMASGTTVGYVSGAAQTVSATPTYPNLTLSGAGAKTIAGTTTVQGNFTSSGGTITLAAARTINLGGNWNSSSALSSSVRLNLNLNGTGDQTITNSVTPFTLLGFTIDKAGGTATLAVNVTNANNAAGDFTLTAGTLDLSTYTLTSLGTGAFTLSNGTILKIGGTNTLPSGYASYTIGATSTVEYYGTNQTIGATTYGNLTINQSSGDATLSGAATVNGTLTLTAGNLAVTDPNELTMGASATTVGATDVTGIVTRTSFIAGTSYTFGNQYTTVNFRDGGDSLPSAVSVKITIGSAPTWKADAVQRTYSFKRTGGSNTWVTWNAHYLDGELNGNTENKLVYWVSATPSTPESGIEFGRSNYNTTNNWVTSTAFDVSSWGTSFLKQGTLGDSDLTSSTWNGSTSSVWNLPANWTPNGVPSDTTDVVIPAAGEHSNPTLNPILAVGRLTIQSDGILNSSADSIVTISGGSGAWSNNGGNFSASTSTVVFTNAAATISGVTDFYNVTINADAAVTMAENGTMRIGGTMTNNGTWRAAQLPNTTVEYNGGSQTVLNPNGATPGYHSLILSGSGTKTLPGTALSILGDFSMSGTASATALAALNTTGSFTVGSGTSFTTGALSHSIGGDFSNSGTFTATGSTVTLNGTAAQAIGGDTTTAFNNLTINKASGTATLSNNITCASDLTVTAGTLDLSSYTANRATSGGTLAVNNGTTLKIGGTNSLPTNYTAHTFGATSTIEYSGAAQTVSSETYGHLTTSTGGTKTLGGAVTVDGNLTIGASTTLDVSGSNHALNVKGNWTNSGAFTAQSGTVTLNGSGAQAMSGATTFYDLTLNNSNGLTISSDETISHTLTFTSGNITTGANTLIISSGGSVSRASGHIVGNLQKAINTNGTVSRTFEVGTGSDYTPIDVTIYVVAGSGASGQTLTGSSTSGEHPNISTSFLNSAKNVNRYWTLTHAGSWTFTSYNAKFTFVDTDKDGGANTSYFVVRKYTSGAWFAPPQNATTANSTTGESFTSFSSYAVGEPAWQSYQTDAYTTVWGTTDPSHPYSSSYSTVYMYGDGFTAGHSYSVGFYDADGTKIGSNISGTLIDSTLIAQFSLGTNPEATAWIWHAVVFDTDLGGSPPGTYAECSGATGYVTEDDFDVGVDAIPEFPTIFASIGVVGLCAGIYYRMHKKKLAASVTGG